MRVAAVVRRKSPRRPSRVRRDVMGFGIWDLGFGGGAREARPYIWKVEDMGGG